MLKVSPAGRENKNSRAGSHLRPGGRESVARGRRPILGYFTTEAVVTANDSFPGVFTRLPASAEPVLAMPQQLVAGTIIVAETIVSQQATRR